MNNTIYIIVVSFLAMSLAQLLKPFMYYAVNKEFNWRILFDSGGLPSSHSSAVTSLALTVGLLDNFSSTTFAVTFVYSMLIMYDAANVRYYSGKNIELTKQLISDLTHSSDFIIKLTHPIYNEKIKEILGHSWFEVFSGAILGLIVSGISYYIFII